MQILQLLWLLLRIATTLCQIITLSPKVEPPRNAPPPPPPPPSVMAGIRKHTESPKMTNSQTCPWRVWCEAERPPGCGWFRWPASLGMPSQRCPSSQRCLAHLLPAAPPQSWAPCWKAGTPELAGTSERQHSSSSHINTHRQEAGLTQTLFKQPSTVYQQRQHITLSHINTHHQETSLTQTLFKHLSVGNLYGIIITVYQQRQHSILSHINTHHQETGLTCQWAITQNTK